MEAQKRLHIEVDRKQIEVKKRAALALEKQKPQERLDKAAENKNVIIAK